MSKIDKFQKIFKDEETFDKFGKYITHMSSIEFSSFIKKLAEMQLDDRKKEFFQRLRFYSDISKNVDILKDLEITNDDNEKIITVNRDIIDKKVQEKYIGMLRDEGNKVKLNYNENFIYFSPFDILNAIEKVNPNKAISWDYIPGKFITIIKQKLNNEEYMKFISNLSEFYNQLFVNNESIPECLISSRLFCLNKVATDPGNLDNIRPISIFGPLMKIMEKAILEYLLAFIYNNKILNKKQTGFIPLLGCEVNLARLKQRVHDVCLLPGKKQKYLLFIDLKNAYDSVNHQILFEKLRRYNAPDKLVNTIAKIYSNAKMKVNLNLKPMNVNRGVLQGSILSPMLFNIYINDLIEEIDKNAFEVLAYADDIAVICKDKEELLHVMDIIDKWANNNDIKINKKKSGIIVLQHNNNRDEDINGYPLKNQYKYLGIMLNYNLDPTNHLTAVNRKLADYLKRNQWLMKTYFSPKSLLILANYYQLSRLTYGMCIFLDEKTIMDSLEKARMKYFRSIIGTKENIKSNLLRLVLCLPRVEYLLFNRLLNVYDKYSMHFGQRPYIFHNIMKAFFDRTGAHTITNRSARYDAIKWSIIKATADQEGIDIDRKYMANSNKYYYRYPDRRDGLLIRFMANYGFFESRLFPVCAYCGGNNSRTHVVNECTDEFFVNLRKEFAGKIKRLTGKRINENNLEKELQDLYFKTPEKVRVPEALKLLKEFAAKFYIERPYAWEIDTEDDDEGDEA